MYTKCLCKKFTNRRGIEKSLKSCLISKSLMNRRDWQKRLKHFFSLNIYWNLQIWRETLRGEVDRIHINEVQNGKLIVRFRVLLAA